METKKAALNHLKKWEEKKGKPFQTWRQVTVVATYIDFANQQTTSQQQTIERLRKLVYETNVDEIKSTMFSETIALAGHRYEFVEGAKWMLEYFKKSIESEQLLNTKEPIDQ